MYNIMIVTMWPLMTSAIVLSVNMKYSSLLPTGLTFVSCVVNLHTTTLTHVPYTTDACKKIKNFFTFFRFSIHGQGQGKERTHIPQGSSRTWEFGSDCKFSTLTRKDTMIARLLRKTQMLCEEWHFIAGSKLIADFKSIWSLVLDRI